MVNFNVPCDWFESNSEHQKLYSEGGKKIVGVVFYWVEYIELLVACYTHHPSSTQNSIQSFLYLSRKEYTLM